MTASATITQTLENMLSISTRRKLSNVINKSKDVGIGGDFHTFNINWEAFFLLSHLLLIKTEGQEAEKIYARR